MPLLVITSPRRAGSVAQGTDTSSYGLHPGGVAQLVEHLVCNQAVVGSNPVASTISLQDEE